MPQEATAPATVPQSSHPGLTRREHRYLWLMAQGYTPTDAKVIMQTTSTPALSTRIREKLGARTMEQAVFLACQRDLIGEYEDCGTLNGYRGHYGREDVDPCRACRRAFTEYAERQDTPVLKKILLTEPEVRLLRAFDSGRTFKQVMENWGCARRTLDGVRMTLYRKLDVAHLPQSAKFHAALAEGRRLGYLRPEPMPVILPAVPRAEPVPLTDLEVRTLAILADGTSLREAGMMLGGKSGAAISSRLAGIYKKLDVLHVGHGERREAAVFEARRQGYRV